MAKQAYGKGRNCGFAVHPPQIHQEKEVSSLKVYTFFLDTAAAND
jgi:hypothetical protein